MILFLISVPRRSGISASVGAGASRLDTYLLIAIMRPGQLQSRPVWMSLFGSPGRASGFKDFAE
jgi:hypothetical protein